MSARHDAMLRVRGAHPPLAVLFASLRNPGDAAARNAAVVAAVRDVPGWEAYQRFGDPWCPNESCYGRDGTVLADGAPPFGPDCNCSAEPRPVR